jgi:phenylacetate-CoA ligase
LHAFTRHSGEIERVRELDTRLGALRDALWSSPYHARKLHSLAQSPDDLASLTDLRRWPRLTRGELSAHAEELVGPWRGSTEQGELVEVLSSGSSGQPVRVFRSAYDCLHMWPVIRFLHERLAGRDVPQGASAVLLCTLPGGLQYEAPVPLLRDGFLRRISTQHPAPLERLIAAGPSIVSTDPAGLHWLASALEQDPHPALAEGLSLLLSSAQHLSPELRRRFGERCRAPIANIYATTETGPIAWECLRVKGRFHVFSPDVHVESDARALLVTRLREGPLPLLRYETGDSGRVRFEPGCACGVSGHVIEDLHGRRRCNFACPNGERIDAWQLAWLLKRYALSNFRLTQVSASGFRLEVIESTAAEKETPPGSLPEALEQALRNLGWTAPTVELKVVNALLTSGPKPEPFRVTTYS